MFLLIFRCWSRKDLKWIVINNRNRELNCRKTPHLCCSTILYFVILSHISISYIASHYHLVMNTDFLFTKDTENWNRKLSTFSCFFPWKRLGSDVQVIFTSYHWKYIFQLVSRWVCPRNVESSQKLRLEKNSLRDIS